MAFFECPKCKRIWQYPIEKCPECFTFLERVKSKKIKVVGTSKVLIPSIFHPKVPYFVLLLEDENKNKWIQKSEKEYKIGEELPLEVANDEKAVAIWTVKYDFLEGIEKVVELLGGLKVQESSKILILPTVEKPSHSYFRDNTSPEFFEAVLNFLFQWGVKSQNIKVASQSFDEIEIGQKAIKSGLFEICQKYKLKAIDLSRESFLRKGDLEISAEVFEADLILNLPILKIGKTQAIENLFVLLKKENFLGQKYLFSESEILEKLKKNLPKILTIAEANHIRDERGFTFYLNLILGSFIPESVDWIFSKIANFPLPEPFENLNFENISILGRKTEEVKFYRQ